MKLPTHSRKSLSIIIVNYCGRKHLGPCLETLKNQDFKDFELVVVDNNSPDNSWDIAGKVFSDVKLILNKRNAGFSRGMNQGIGRSDSPYVLALNFDTLLEKTFLSNLMHALSVRDGFGSACGKIYRMSENFEKLNRLDSAGHIIIGRWPGNRGLDEVDAGQYDREQIVFSPPGSFALYKREMLDDIAYRGEYFDNSYFMYCEDLDIGWRANIFGWNCLYTPRAQAYHVAHGSFVDIATENRGKSLHRLLPINMELTTLKNDTPEHAAKTLRTMLGRTMRVYRTKAKRWELERLRFWRYLPLALKKRRFNNKKRKVSFDEMEFWFKNDSKEIGE